MKDNFKTSLFGGFKKSDVIAFLNDMSEKIRKDAEQSKAELDASKKDAAGLSDKLAALAAEFEAFKADAENRLKAAENEKAGLSDMLNKANESITLLTDAKNSLTAKLSDAEGRIKIAAAEKTRLLSKLNTEQQYYRQKETEFLNKIASLADLSTGGAPENEPIFEEPEKKPARVSINRIHTK